jgi:ATP-dependent Clp protease adaptor protein ClpS
MASKKDPKDPYAAPGKDKEGGTQILEKPDQKTTRPRLYVVVMHNDDYTTQEFVVYVLMHFFRKEPTEASQLMLKVHTSGKAKVGVYTKDIAETKQQQVIDYARENGHPLMLTVEPEDV